MSSQYLAGSSRRYAREAWLAARGTVGGGLSGVELATDSFSAFSDYHYMGVESFSAISAFLLCLYRWFNHSQLFQPCCRAATESFLCLQGIII